MGDWSAGRWERQKSALLKVGGRWGRGCELAMRELITLKLNCHQATARAPGRRDGKMEFGRQIWLAGLVADKTFGSGGGGGGGGDELDHATQAAAKMKGKRDNGCGFVNSNICTPRPHLRGGWTLWRRREIRRRHSAPPARPPGPGRPMGQVSKWLMSGHLRAQFGARARGQSGSEFGVLERTFELLRAPLTSRRSG